MSPNYARVGLIFLAVGVVVLGLAWLTYAPGAGDVMTMPDATR